jgi:hypothetical protein
MASPAFAILFSAVVQGVTGSGSAGDVLVQSATTGVFVPATTANRGTRRSTGVALQAYANNSAVEIQQFGQIDPVTANLGAGTASWVRVSATGGLERIGTPVTGDDVCGWVEADGTLHACFGFLTAAMVNGGGGSTPTGTGVPSIVAGVQQAAAVLVTDSLVSASAAIAVAKLAPSGTNGQVLTTTAGVTGWAAAAGGGSPAGSASEVQINGAGAFGAATNVKAGAGFLSIGATPATAGDVRLSSTAQVSAWSGAASQTVLQANGTTLNIGQDNAGTTQFATLQAFPSSAFNLGIGATTYASLTSGVVNARVPIACGTGTVASAGDIRLGNTGAIQFDRTGSNINGLWMDTGTSLAVGNGNATNVTIYSGGGIIIGSGGATTIQMGVPIVGLTAFSSPYGVHGHVSIAFPGATLTRTTTAAEYALSSQVFTGARTAASLVTYPAPASDAAAYYKWVQNSTTGGFNLTITTGAGATVALGAGGAPHLLRFDVSVGVTQLI